MKKGLFTVFVVFLLQAFSIGSALALTNTSDSTEFTMAAASIGSKTIYIQGDATSYLKVGYTIVIDKSSDKYEVRDIATINYNPAMSGGTTIITFINGLINSHPLGAKVDRAVDTIRIDQNKLKLTSVDSADTITIVDADSLLKVGDTIIVNPGDKWDSYTVTRDIFSPNAKELMVNSVTGLQPGDSLIMNKGKANEEIAIIDSVDAGNGKLVFKEDIVRDYSSDTTAYRMQIEKSQILSIVNNGGSSRTLTLRNALRYAHNSGEAIVITNTASSPYEHDSSYSNHQNEGNQITKSYNTGQMNEVIVPATNGPHGKYTSNTNACGRCHQLHAAPAPKLVRFPITAAVQATNPIYATCTFCHTFNGQSTYDVKNGQIWDTSDGKRYATNGGGFERMLVVEGDPKNATLAKVTSKHRVNEQWINGTYVKFNAPGGYMSTGGHVELTCTSCHQPHGTKNGRQLVEQVTVQNGPGSTDTRSTTTGDNNAVIINVENPFQDEKTKYSKEIISFCSACHYDYNSTSGSSVSGTFSQKYRHKMGMVPYDGMNQGNVEKNFGFGSVNALQKLILPLGTEGKSGADPALGNPGVVVCTTCHFAHGTFTKTEGVKQYDDIKLNTNVNLNTVGGWETSKNLRLDNRGVCQNCHNRMKDTTPPQLSVILDPDFDGSDIYESTASLDPEGDNAASYTDDTVMIRFNQYMWTNKMYGLEDSMTQGYNFDVENIENYDLKKDPNGASTSLKSKITMAKLQPDGRTIMIYFEPGTLPESSGEYQVVVNNVADLNWNIVSTPQTANFTK